MEEYWEVSSPGRSGPLKKALSRGMPLRQRIDRLYRQHATEGIRFAVAVSGSNDLAEDLLQDAFVKVMSRMRDRGDPANFRNYLYACIVNGVRSNWRSVRRERLLLLRQGGPDEHQPCMTDGVEDRAELRERLMILPPRQRAALFLMYYEGRSEQEAAMILGVSVGAVRSLVNRAKRKIRSGEE
jgi:RNA polymerase sigma-70 factor (ECF subfamily)